MKNQRMLVGFSLGVIASLVIGAAANQSPLEPSGQVGRFQITDPNELGAVYVIDTTSGQVWSNRRVGARSELEFLKPKVE